MASAMPHISAGGGGAAAARALSSGAGRSDSAFARTPMFSKPLDDDEHAAMNRMRKGVLQVFVHKIKNQWRQPWSKARPSSSRGSAFIVDLAKKIIVTNAHVAAFASTIEVRIDGDDDKHEARVLAVAHQVDIAILSVENPAFWASAVALEVGDDPREQQHVDVVGFPEGDEEASITSGVVSKIGWKAYSHSESENLCITIDAAINGGNSGGPCISKGKVVGINFQGRNDAQNIGHIIPASVLKRTLEDFHGAQAAGASAALKGFASFAPTVQPLENEALRRSQELPEGQAGGILVTTVPRVSNLHGVLEPGDVIVAVDGKGVSKDGRVHRAGGMSLIDFRADITMKLVGEPLRYTVFRRGEKEPRELSVAAERAPQLTPKTWFGETSFSIFAGLVLTPVLDGELGREADMYGGHMRSAYKASGRKHEHAHQQLVMVVTQLPHRLMLGYEHDPFAPLVSIDGAEVLCLADAHRLCAASAGPFTTFVFADDSRVVLPTAESRAATLDLMHKHGIAKQASEDVIAAAAAATAAAAAPPAATSAAP